MILTISEAFNPYVLLDTIQTEKENNEIENLYLKELIEKIDTGIEPMQIKANLKDLVYQLIQDYFARGIKVGVQMYVALMENLDEEEL